MDVTLSHCGANVQGTIVPECIINKGANYNVTFMLQFRFVFFFFVFLF